YTTLFRSSNQAEVGFRFAAARRKPQKVRDLSVIVLRPSNTAKTEQDKGNLERAPPLGGGQLDAGLGTTLTMPIGTCSLLEHGKIHESKCPPYRVIRLQQLDTGPHSL